MENTDTKKTLRYSIMALAFGIVSINLCWIDYCTPVLFFIYPPFGIIFGYLGKKIAAEGFKMVAVNPEAYSGTNMLKIGKILSAIGFIVGIVSAAIGIIIAICMWSGMSNVFDLPVPDLW
ncbi:MAG: hypothetical protein LBG17_09120 [Bacteroidales bacterium]|jgi:hypothetical protein|nr:hypothetical protein [Bacteroidales bacterium]